jgi:hypothetical protein
MTNKMIKTNKGTFKVRYIYEGWNATLGKINIIVINDPENKQPFTGDYGDEIPMHDIYKKQYNATIIDGPR